ncbi:hypothetical protein H2200_010440 [Cladophialophora chaetospira]|uniref:Uncharacterized protein n=1 Tax=Cladophialophora chaetospira TaxID=386627 RepID=A0AA38X1K0_9EURO|nr:hypothetical protein H2200_010440 [Cladophialophora chaetospira]
MAPRIYADKPKQHKDRVLRPSSSPCVRPKITHSHRLARNGTITQLETVVPSASTSTRHSPSSRGRLLLEATDQLDIPEELEALRITINNRYDGDTFDTRFIATEWGSTPALQLPEIDHESSPEEVTDLIEQITNYFDFWSQDDPQEGPASLFADMRLINNSLEDVAELPWEVVSSATVSAALRECMGLYESFAESWHKAALEALVIKLDRLRAQVRARMTSRLTTIHEIEFVSFVSDVAAVSPRFLHQEIPGSTEQSIPFLVSEAETQQLLESADKLLFAFQDATYETEAKELWLLIWRSLKVAFAAFIRGGAPTSPTNTLRDRQFFEVPLVRLEMQRLIRSNEASNPRSIEEIVGMYCRYIYQCQIDEENKYESLHRTQETPLGSHTKDALKEFYKTGKFETSTLAKLHFAVARFNKINGGPVKIRRWRAPHDNGVWQTIPLDLDSAATPHFSPSTSSHGGLQQAAQSSPPFTPRSPSFENSIVDKPAKRIFPFPEGINLKSDFDYVWYPFPETRAHEIVQSEQITREMAEPGVLSEGPRPDYLINRPPRHTRDPAELARRNFGPFPWIFWVLKQLFAKERRLRKVKKPRFAGLSQGKSCKSPSNTGTPILDGNARVHKSIVPAQVSGLRGGGGHLPKPLAGSGRGHYFDSTAFSRKMTDLCVRNLRGRYGVDTFIDRNEIQELLRQTGYDFEEVAMRYTAPGRGKNAAPMPQDHAQLNEIYPYRGTITDRHQHLYPAEEGELQERVNNSPRATAGAFNGDDIYDEDGEGHSDLENDDPEPDDLPLGELPPGDYPDSRGVRGRGVPPSSHSPPIRERQVCHPCPKYVGQYHHVCEGVHDCAGYRAIYPTGNDQEDGLPRDQYGDLLFGQAALDWVDARNAGPADEAHEQDGDDDVDHNGPAEGDGPRPNEPFHRNPADVVHDDWTVEAVFGQEENNFRADLEDIRVSLQNLEPRLEPQNRAWETDATDRVDFIRVVTEELAEPVRRRLRNIYASLARGTRHLVEEIYVHQRWRPRPRTTRSAHAATPRLIMRLFQDVQHHHRRLREFFNFEQPRSNLEFRDTFNALIIAVRQLYTILREYDQAQRDPNFNADGEDDDEPIDDDNPFDTPPQPTSPPAEQPSKLPSKSPSKPPSKSPSNSHPNFVETHPSPGTPTPGPRDRPTRATEKPTKSPQPDPLPGVEAYNRMFRDEIVRELEQNRNVDIKTAIDKKNPTKQDLIDLLVQLDKEGNIGRGATEGYRNLTGNFNAHSRPRGWDIEDEVKRYWEQKAKEENAARRSPSSSSHKRNSSSHGSNDTDRTKRYGPFFQ